MARILIVDDHPSNRKFLTTLLAYASHETVEASDGVEGLEVARQTRPDLIITDILMPASDGYEFVRRLREDTAIASIPVIFYSAAYLGQEARALAAKCGVEHVLLKSGDPEEVLQTVNLALGTASAPLTAPADGFDRDHIQILTDKLSTQADELESQNQKLQALIALGRELSAAENPQRLAEVYCEGARQIVGAAQALVAIIAERAGNARYIHGAGYEPGYLWQAVEGGNAGIFVEAFRRRECIRGVKAESAPDAAGNPGAPPIRSYLSAPILWRGEAFGWMGFSNKIGYDAFTEEDEKLAVMLAEHLALAVENWRLLEESNERARQLERESEERRKSAERYQMVLEHASDGIAIAGGDGHYLEANLRLLEMLRYTRERFLALHMDDLLPPKDAASDPIDFDRLRAGGVVRRERTFVRGDASTVEVEISISRLLDGRLQTIVRDVAERKCLEQQLRQAQKLEAVGRLAGGVAHDFNNLLTVILGHSDLVLSSLDEGDRRWKDVLDIREAGARAAVLTGQLLAFSRKQILQPKVLSINTALSNLAKMLSRLISSNIEITTTFDPALWDTKVDPTQLDQVILNLAINAKDAMPLGGKLVLATANQPQGQTDPEHPDVPDGDYTTLAVTDTGCGMNADTRSHLFEPFFTTKEAGKGTGLGLSTVYGIIQQSGGHIRVSSEPGKGSTFKIYLPKAASIGETSAAQSESAALPYGNETVLVAEDDERVRSLATAVLRQQGYSVLEGGDGEEALRVASDHSGEIHLLMTDLMMPKMNGFELAEAALRSRPGMKVMYTSGYAGDVAMPAGAPMPAIPLLKKPFTPRMLAVKVREALEGIGDAVSIANLTESWARGQEAGQSR